MKRVLTAAGVTLVVFAALAPTIALAQTGYPGTTTTEKPGPTEEHKTVAPLRPGESERVDNCGYRPDSPGTLTVNDNAGPPVTFGSDGCTTLTVEHVENEQALPARAVDLRTGGAVFAAARTALNMAAPDDCGFLRINGVVYEAKQGSNKAVVEGTGANSAPRTTTNNIVLTCRGGGDSVRGTSQSRGVDAGTGTGDRADRQARASRGARLPLLGRTGFAVVQWSGVGLALLVIGAVAVIVERRRLARRVRA